ncbi:MAG: cytochrome c3 family protein [Deltaproteobacteria bacterium]|nr:cytochrome c3 family protein [Deltaproteobacteria bacterium]MBW2444700.1 cytochrome c3 family protein [Deltaproteobacteria bacterium]
MKGAKACGSRVGMILLALGLGLPVGGFFGCAPDTRYRVLSTVFDGVPPPGTPRPERRGRRVAKAEPPTAPPSPGGLVPGTVVPGGPEPEPEPKLDYESYEALAQALPDDGLGNLDWVAAVAERLIEPAPGPEEDAPAAPILPHDVVLDPGVPLFQAVFPHEPHTYWLRCDSCHPSIFVMRAGANPITMAKIFEGEFCGRCHGKVAFAPETGCPRCHVKLGRPAPTASVPDGGGGASPGPTRWEELGSLPAWRPRSRPAAPPAAG